MTDEPLATFGSLMSVCVSDRKVSDRFEAVEGAAVLLLGVGCSLVTVYVLSILGVLV